MNVKVTIKSGDKVRILTDEEINAMNKNEQQFSQMITARAYINMIVNAIEMTEPDTKGKRIEIITEFQDDGFYMVIGRKPKEVTEFGT